MTEQEGGKPQLTIVVPAATPERTYADQLDELLASLGRDKRAAKLIDTHEVVRMLAATENNAVVRDWLADNDVMTKGEFNRAMARKKADERVEAEIGFVPTNALDFVRRYAEHRKIRLTPRGLIKRSRSYDFKRFVTQDGAVEASRTKGAKDLVITAENKDTCPQTSLIYDVINSTDDNLDSFARELRLVADALHLGFRDSVIGDAVQTWKEETSELLRVDALNAILYAKGRATGPEGQAMWRAMEAACFDVTGTAPGFAIAVIQKFMWQVKRKGRGMDVTNHLMPVLTGAQGKGKTEFVKAMTRPLQDFMRNVDFNMLTDSKTTDIWSALILFIDEMGGFTRQDVDAVKNIITATDMSIRTMRQNHSAVIRNQATLIGCSNKDLAQLIRDDTGVRRFAELVWRNDPDWEASNAVNWSMLWQSVDENGPDPMVARGMTDTLKGQQEANRNQGPVETWARLHGGKFKKWASATDLYLTFRDFEEENFPSNKTSLLQFGRQLANLISTMPDFLMEKQQYQGSNRYKAI